MTEYIGWLTSNRSIVLDESQEIVRCRDCKWFIDDPDMYTSRPFCDYLDGIHFKPNDFCSYGKRKEGGDDR